LHDIIITHKLDTLPSVSWLYQSVYPGCLRNITQHFERTANQQAEIRDRYFPNKRPCHPTLCRTSHNSSIGPNKAPCQL